MRRLGNRRADGNGSGGNTFFSPRLRPWGLLGAAGAVLCFCTVAGFLGGLWWPLDLCSHFRVQYLLGLAGLTAIFAIGRRFRAALAFLAFAAANLAVVLPLYFGGSPAGDMEGCPRLRVMLMNVNTACGDAERVLAAIRKEEPDVVLLEEVSSRWLKALAPLRERYPHSVTEPRDDNFGIALYSRLPVTDADIVQIGDADVPSVVAKVEVGDRTLTVVGTHPLPPASPEYARLRDGQLAALPGFLGTMDPPVAVLGDLNVSPWSWHFRLLLKRTGLRDSARGFGVQPSWPTTAWPLLIPIDHCLVSAEVAVLDRRVGEAVGSDHLPVVVDLALR